MDRQREHTWTEVRGLLRSPTGDYLVVRSWDADAGVWEFPGGPTLPHLSPEECLRRQCRENLGLEIGPMVAQEPFSHHFGTHRVTYRYYFGWLDRDDAVPLGYAAARLVAPEGLLGYGFTPDAEWMVSRLLRSFARD